MIRILLSSFSHLTTWRSGYM